MECTLRLCLTIVDDMFARLRDFTPMGKSDIFFGFQSEALSAGYLGMSLLQSGPDYTGDVESGVDISWVRSLSRSHGWQRSRLLAMSSSVQRFCP